MRLGPSRWIAALVVLSCALAACKVEAPAGQLQGEEKAAASAVVTAAAPSASVAALNRPTITPVVTATQAAPPVTTPPPITPSPTARPSASVAQKPPVQCPAIACAMPPGCMEMGHDANGCPNCTCARGIPSLQGPPRPGQLPPGVPR